MEDKDKLNDDKQKEIAYLEGQLERSLDYLTKEVISDLSSLLERKGKNYGDTLLEPVNIFSQNTSLTDGIDLRLDDKMARIKYSSCYKEDTYMDIAGYLARRIAIVRRISMQTKIEELKNDIDNGYVEKDICQGSKEEYSGVEKCIPRLQE